MPGGSQDGADRVTVEPPRPDRVPQRSGRGLRVERVMVRSGSPMAWYVSAAANRRSDGDSCAPVRPAG